MCRSSWKICVIDQLETKMAGYWQVLGPWTRKKERDQYPANKEFIIWPNYLFLREHSEQSRDSFILPARVANQSKGFASSFPPYKATEPHKKICNECHFVLKCTRRKFSLLTLHTDFWLTDVIADRQSKTGQTFKQRQTDRYDVRINGTQALNQYWEDETQRNATRRDATWPW